MILYQYKIMRTILLVAFSFFLFCSCDPGYIDKEYEYKLQVKNASNSKVTLLGYDSFDDTQNKLFVNPILKKTIIIESNNYGPIVVNKNIFSTVDNSTYFFGLHIDSLVLKFENGQGYYSTVINGLDNDNWIPNKSSLLNIQAKDVQKEGGVYIYTITQEDYENAHTLP